MGLAQRIHLAPDEPRRRPEDDQADPHQGGARVGRHLWLMILSGIGEPLFYLLSIGVGLGHLVGTVGGVSYTAYVAPALLATSSMNGAIYDSTFNVFFLIKYAKTHKDPVVRKEAIFWLGESKDPRALDFLEQVVLGKQ